MLHPLDGRRVPIITDAELVDMAFGTGAVKITPAHDPNDFEAGLRHRSEGVEFINILADDGTVNARGGRFAGQPRFQARQKKKRKKERGNISAQGAIASHVACWRPTSCLTYIALLTVC